MEDHCYGNLGRALPEGEFQLDLTGRKMENQGNSLDVEQQHN